MGPFELMDLVGIDVGFTISKSFFEQSFGEPRWRPSPLAGARGRRRPARAQDRRGLVPLPRRAAAGPRAAGARRRRRAGGDRGRERAGRASSPRPPTEAGWDVAAPEDADGRGPVPDRRLRRARTTRRCRAARSCCCATPRRSPRWTPAARRAGFHLLPPLGRARRADRHAVDRARHARRRRALLRHARDGHRAGRRRARPRARPDRRPARQRGVRSRSARASARPRTSTPGMVLGLNHPRGPLEWGDAIGAAEVLVLLARAAARSTGEERYRPAPALLRAARAGEPLRADRLACSRARVPPPPPASRRSLAAAAPARRRRPPPTPPELRAASPEPMQLPGDASAVGVRADRAPGSSAPGPAPAPAPWRAAFGARRIGPAATTWSRAGDARAFAARAAQPRPARSTPSPNALRAHQAGRPRRPAVRAARTPGAPPSPTRTSRRRRSRPTSPLIALLDTRARRDPPRVRRRPTSRTLGGRAARQPARHGDRRGRGRARRTASASSASGPGARALNVPLPARAR